MRNPYPVRTFHRQRLRYQVLLQRYINIIAIFAGYADSCSQKIHNLLYSYKNVPDDVEILAFADSDACLGPSWLSHLVHPLRREKHGASTGYRWFIPSRNNLASLALSAINAKVAQLLGDTRFNQVWGGSMAIRKDVFERTSLDKLWQNAISDDLCLSGAVKKNGLKIMFAPGCMIASYENTTWAGLFEFTRRQFLITRVTLPGTWWFGFISSLYALSGLWAGAAIAISASVSSQRYIGLYIAVPTLFFIGQLFRAILRQKMIRKLLPGDVGKMKPAMIADILGNWVWSWLLFGCILVSAFGRTITWRGIKYKLKGPTETIIVSENKSN